MRLRCISLLLSFTATGFAIQFLESGAYLLAAQQQIEACMSTLTQDRARYFWEPPTSRMSARAGGQSPTEADMREAIRLNPTDRANYLRLGIFLENRERQDESIAVYQAWIQNAPPERLPYLRLGDILLSQLQINEAITTYREALEVPLSDTDQGNLSNSLSSSKIYIRIGDLLQLQGREAEALQAYIQGAEEDFSALGTTEQSLIAYFNPTPIAFPLYLQLDLLPALDLQQADRVYRELIQAVPEAALGYYWLTNLLMSQNRFDEAISIYKTWIPLAPEVSTADTRYEYGFSTNPDRYLARMMAQKARYLEETGNLEGAVATYRDAKNVAPDLVGIYLDLIKILFQLNDLDSVEDEYRQWISQSSDPSSSRLYLEFGRLLACQGRADEAIAAYSQAASTNRTALPAAHFLGNLLAERGSLEKAAHSYRTVLEIHRSAGSIFFPVEAFEQYDALMQQARWRDAISVYKIFVYEGIVGRNTRRRSQPTGEQPLPVNPENISLRALPAPFLRRPLPDPGPIPY